MKKLAVLVLLLFVAPRIAKAGVGVWTPFGPGAPDVVRVALAPGPAGSILYALAPDDGIFCSRDEGESWEWWSLGIGRAWYVPADFFAVDAVQPLALYSAKYNQGIHRSFDGGRTWVGVQPIPGDPAPDILTVAGFDGTLYAGTGFGADGVSVSWSDDGGATWHQSSSSVRISRDGGRTWASYNAGLARPGIEDILKLYPDPLEPGRFFALPASGGTYEVEVP